jgi:hypothetical protein
MFSLIREPPPQINISGLPLILFNFEFSGAASPVKKPLL